MPIRLQQTALPQFGGSSASANLVGVVAASGVGVLTASIGSTFTPNVGSPSSTFDFQTSGTGDAFAKIQVGLPGGGQGLVRGNWFNLGGNGTNEFQANDNREFRFRIDSSSGSSPVGFPDYCRGWSDSEGSTNALKGALGIPWSSVTKCRVYQNLYTDGMALSVGGRGWSLLDWYESDVQYPDTSRTHIAFNYLGHQKVSDPLAESFLGNNFKNHSTAFDLVVNQFNGTVTYRVYHTSPVFSNTRDFYLTPKSDGYPTNGDTPTEWGPNTHIWDVLAIANALRAHPNTSGYYTATYYLVSLQPGFEPIKHSGSVWSGMHECWIAVNDEPDGGEAVPRGGIISTSIPTYASLNPQDGGYASQPHIGASDYYRSSGALPTIRTYRMGTVRPANKDKLIHVWQAIDTYGYNHNLIGQPAYNNVAEYTIDEIATDYGPTPTSGWTNHVTVSGNAYNTRSHVIAPSVGAGMLRMRITAADGSSGNTDVKFRDKVLRALYASESSTRPVNLFAIMTDSNGANACHWGPVNGDKGIDERIYDLIGYHVATHNMGWPGITASTLAGANFSTFQAHLATFPGLIVCLNYGTNADASDTVYRDAMITLAEEVVEQGMIPAIGNPPTQNPAAHIASYVAMQDDIIAAVPGSILGVDLYNATLGQSWLGDQFHGSAEGYANYYRPGWAGALASRGIADIFSEYYP